MKIRNLRWWIATLIFVSTVINYIDRQTLSVVAPVLTRELSISQVEYGYILQWFLVAYTVMYVVSGVLVDRWGTRFSLAVFVAWWSAANALHMFARSAFQLAAFRFLLGVGEPGNYMAAGRAASEWYPPKERAFINGLVNAGSAIGAVIATPLVAWITVRYGWRVAFVAAGALGFVWLIFWLLLYRLPDQHRLITPAELELIRSAPDPAEEGPRASWAGLWRQREVWGLMLARFFSEPVWWFYLFWMPKYLVEQRGFTLTEVGVIAWLPYLTSDLGALAGGWLSGRLIARSRPILRARYATMLPAVLFMPVSIAIPFLSSATYAMGLICVVTFFHQVWKTNLMTITNDIYPVKSVGSVSGIVSLGSGLGGVVFMNITGRIVDAFSYSSVFVIMGFLHPLAYLICRVLVRPDRPAMVMQGQAKVSTARGPARLPRREGDTVPLP
jgi:MFS transporter, ACS family, hexuronate transporter